MTALAELLQRATARRKGAWGSLTQPRIGIMLHYSAGSDLSGVQWLLFDPKCNVSYNWLVLDDGTAVSVAPQDARAYHAGVCSSSDAVYDYSDANSAFYGLAIAAEAGDVVTAPALAIVVDICVGLFIKHHWPADQVFARLTTHAAEAWPRGRKTDTGTVLPLRVVQDLVRERLVDLESARIIARGDPV